MDGFTLEDCIQLLNVPNSHRTRKWSDELLFIESSFNCFPSGAYYSTQENQYQQQRIDYSNSSSFQEKSLHSSSQSAEKEDPESKAELQSNISEQSKNEKKKTGCNCKKSSCLKYYCQCYSSTGFCNENCRCLGCKNKASNMQMISTAKNKSRHISTPNAIKCQCKKSKCQKKYCECFQAGVPCGKFCKCLGCDNCEGGSKSCFNKQCEVTLAK